MAHSSVFHSAGWILAFAEDVECETLVDQFEAILPLAVNWACEQELRILRDGSPLSSNQLADARAAGVREPERVRLLVVEEIPTPPDPVVSVASKKIASLPQTPRGLTLHYGIFVRSDCRQNRQIVVHELVHTAQYERLGGTVAFLRDYLIECAAFGYQNAPLEQEAEQIAAQICRA